MSTEYRFINFRARKVIDLNASLRGCSIWSQIFDDYIANLGCRFDELFSMLVKARDCDPRNEQTDAELLEYAGVIFKFFTGGEPFDFAMYADCYCEPYFVDPSLQNSDMEQLVHSIAYDANCLAWIRCNGLTHRCEL